MQIKFHLIYQVHYNIGKVLSEKGETDAAINYYRKSIRFCFDCCALCISAAIACILNYPFVNFLKAVSVFAWNYLGNHLRHEILRFADYHLYLVS